MPVIPTGSLSLTLTNLKALIAASPTWQSWVRPQAPSLTAGQASIYLIGLPPPEEIDNGSADPGYTADQFQSLRPFSLINFNPRGGSHYEQIALNAFLQTSHILFSFEDAVTDEDAVHYSDAVLKFLNNVGGVLDDMQSASGQNGLCNVRNIRIEKPVTRADQTEAATRGDYHFILLSAEIGI